MCPSLIPDSYLPDVHMRLILYKRIAGAASADDLDDLKAEIFDRFGPLPPAGPEPVPHHGTETPG